MKANEEVEETRVADVSKGLALRLWSSGWRRGRLQETKGTVEFPVFYDKCTNSEMRAALERSGFTVKHTLFSYYQSDYFDAFLPAFLVSALFGQMMSTINAKNLAAYMLVIAEKKTAV